MNTQQGDGEARLDSARTANAVVVSRGFGLGQVEARRYLAGLDDDQVAKLVTSLHEDLNTSHELAQRCEVPFAEYVSELVQKGEVGEAGADLESLYRAGFDVGFSARLVESLESAVSGSAKIV
jgi:hypothetical protein